MGKALGWGAAYRYPHDFKGHYVREEYLPEELRGHRYYEPSDSGAEREIAARQASLLQPDGGAEPAGQKK
jgi:putative ATPase